MGPDIVLDYLSIIKYVLPVKDLSEKISYFIVFVIWTKKPNLKALDIKEILLEKGKVHYLSRGQ